MNFIDICYMKSTTCFRKEADIYQIEEGKKKLILHQKEIVLLAEALHLLGNEVRLKIIFLLSKEKSLCVCDLSDILEMKIQAISQHLRKLKDRNLVITRRDAQTIFYSLTDKAADLVLPILIKHILYENKI